MCDSLWKHCCHGCFRAPGASPQHLTCLIGVAVSWFFPHSSCDFSGSYYDGWFFYCIPDILAIMLEDSGFFFFFFFKQAVALLRLSQQAQADFCGLRFQWQFNLSLVFASAAWENSRGSSRPGAQCHQPHEATCGRWICPLPWLQWRFHKCIYIC